MLEPVERIAPIKGAEYDVNHPFDRKKSADEYKQAQEFAALLRETAKKRSAAQAAPEAYALNITARATQSLFYEDGSGIAALQGRIHAAE
jgi:hypothetical protein